MMRKGVSIVNCSALRLQYILVILLVLINSSVFAQAKSDAARKDWLYFVGLAESDWRFYVKSLPDGEFFSPELNDEPREVYFHGETQSLYYIGSDGGLWLAEIRGQNPPTRLYLPKGGEGISQPFFDSVSNSVFLMYMPEGKSSQADLAVWKDGKLNRVVKQLSSQFEPVVHNGKWLYYGNVHCLIDCGKIIREIWKKNLVSGEASQVTLTGGIARHHSISGDQGRIYFSANIQGRYHIWYVSMHDGRMVQLTHGDYDNDSSPAPSAAGDLFFIRNNAGIHRLLKIRNNVEEAVALPKSVVELRNLRVNQ